MPNPVHNGRKRGVYENHPLGWIQIKFYLQGPPWKVGSNCQVSSKSVVVLETGASKLVISHALPTS